MGALTMLRLKASDTIFGLQMMVQNLAVIVLHDIQPSALPHVQVRPIHQMPQNLVISITSAHDPI